MSVMLTPDADSVVFPHPRSVEAALTLHLHLSSSISSSLHHRAPVKEPHCSAPSVCGLSVISLRFSSSSSLGLPCGHMLGPASRSLDSSACGVTDYYETYSLLGLPRPMPGDMPGTLDHPCHCPPLPNQTEDVMRSKAVCLPLFFFFPSVVDLDQRIPEFEGNTRSGNLFSISSNINLGFPNKT